MSKHLNVYASLDDKQLPPFSEAEYECVVNLYSK